MKGHPWQVLGPANYPVVYPLNDLRDHNAYAENCWCRPVWKDGVLVHNSLDRREEYEEGRKPS